MEEYSKANLIAENARLKARLAEVIALCDGASGDHIGGVTVVRVPAVRAAARGEGTDA